MNDNKDLIPPVIQTQALSKSDQRLREKFSDDFFNQSNRLDSLAQRLIVLELAIPGLYATTLKLVAGDEAKLAINTGLYITFIAWFLALLFTLWSLMPKRWQVDETSLRGQWSDKSKAMSIEAYFIESAKHKRRWLWASCFCFFAGIIAAVLSIF